MPEYLVDLLRRGRFYSFLLKCCEIGLITEELAEGLEDSYYDNNDLGIGYLNKDYTEEELLEYEKLGKWLESKGY